MTVKPEPLEPFPAEVLALHARLTAPETHELALIACRVAMMKPEGRFPRQVTLGPDTLAQMRRIIGMNT